MANSGGIITAPVRLIADVKTVLGSSNNTLGTLCRSELINKYAKYKPIKFASYGPITDAQRLSANHGFGTPKEMRIFYKDCNATQWNQWSAPNGGNSAPYRLGDFDGYDHNAASFVKSLTVRTSHKDGVSLIASPTEPGLLYADLSFEVSNLILKFSDFQINGRNFSDMYLHAALFPLQGANLNNDSAIHGQYYKVSELGEAASFTLTTAPDSAFYNKMASDPVAAFVIGITESDDNSRATTFWSPVILSEWARFKWITEYTSFKPNNGIIVVQDMYFKGGMSVYPTLSLRMSDDQSSIELHITSMFVFLQQTDKSGVTITHNGASSDWCLINGELSIGQVEARRFSVELTSYKGASSFEITDFVTEFDRGLFNTGSQEWRCRFTMSGNAVIKPGTTTRVEYHLLGDYSGSYKRETYEQTGSINIAK